MLCKVKQARAVQHQFREANAVADCLANVGISKQQSLVFGSFQDLPRLARGSVVMEKANLPYIRIRRC